MGCHTWFRRPYKSGKVEDVVYDVQKALIDTRLDYASRVEEFKAIDCDDIVGLHIQDCLSFEFHLNQIFNYSPTNPTPVKPYTLVVLGSVLADMTLNYNRRKKLVCEPCKEVDGYWLGDRFRVYKGKNDEYYPDFQWCSFAETVIKLSNEEFCAYHSVQQPDDEGVEAIQRFFEVYPDGYISFG